MYNWKTKKLETRSHKLHDERGNGIRSNEINRSRKEIKLIFFFLALFLTPNSFTSFSGLTGVLLFIVMVIIFVFAHPLIRKRAYKFFWSAHSLYIVLYALCLVHGLARLTGAPRFWLFFIGPGIVYILDKVFILFN